MVASSSLPLQQQLNDVDAAVAAAEAAIPAAEPVERGRLLVGGEDEDYYDDNEDDPINDQTTTATQTSNKPNNTPNGVVSTTTTTEGRQLLIDGCDDAPASPDSFNADELFENILIGYSNDDNDHSYRITDHDLENLLSEGSNGGSCLPYLLPSRRTVRNTLETSTEEDDDDDDSSSDRNDNDNNDDVHNNDQQRRMRRYRKKRNKCHCCSTAATRLPCCCCCSSSSNNFSFSYVGNMIIVLPICYNNIRLRFGIIGPHWFGPICTATLLISATIYYVPRAFNNIGPISSIICLLFYTIALASLLVVSCTDPGIVRAGGLDNAAGGGGRHSYSGLPTSDMTAARRGWRYCDLCSVYQPPNAVHCPECNVCIEGYDHHCPWMGMCIGGRNYRAFMVFNISWLLYLLYVIVWVVLCGPRFWSLVE